MISNSLLNRLFFCLVLGLQCPMLCAQHEVDNWYFGYNAGISFNTQPPTSLANGQLVTDEGCASWSDASGNLLFYSNGEYVWDRNHNLMPNGFGLNGSSFCSQSALVVPYPGQDSLFYLFTPSDDFAQSGLRYSLVDLTLNNGLGDITNKNTLLFASSTEKVAAVRHANGTDYWVIGHGFGNADFYVYQVTASGLNTSAVISTAGTPHDSTTSNMIGIMKISPCGDKLALTVSYAGFAELFDFDNSTGIVSNAINLGMFTPNLLWGLYGLEFSPGGTRLYLTQEQPALLVQFDLAAGTPAAIVASRDTIVYYDTSNIYLAGMQLGPDGIIYVSRIGKNYLACIHSPDSLGSACNFNYNGVMLTTGFCQHGLPEFVSSLFCQPTGQPGIETFPVSLSPNPAENEIIISFTTMDPHISVDFLTVTGRLINSFSYSPSETYKADVSQLSSGIYLVRIQCGNQICMKKIIKL